MEDFLKTRLGNRLLSMHFLCLHGMLLAFKFLGGAKKFALFGVQLDKLKKKERKKKSFCQPNWHPLQCLKSVCMFQNGNASQNRSAIWQRCAVNHFNSLESLS